MENSTVAQVANYRQWQQG